jgi:hypothetical protein
LSLFVGRTIHEPHEGKALREIDVLPHCTIKLKTFMSKRNKQAHVHNLKNEEAMRWSVGGPQTGDNESPSAAFFKLSEEKVLLHSNSPLLQKSFLGAGEIPFQVRVKVSLVGRKSIPINFSRQIS